ncbi:hypothetical protein Tco_0291307 [Tanacetum coccineum]
MLSYTKDESLDLDTEREGSEGEGPGSEDEGPGSEDEGSGSEDEVVNEPLGLGYEALRRHQRVEETPAPRIPIRTTWVDLEDGIVYLYIEIYPRSYAPVQTPASPEWSSGSLLVSPSSLVASPFTTPATTIAVDEDEFLDVGAQLKIHGSILHDHTQRLDALLPALFKGYDMDFRELYTRSREVRDEIFSQCYRLRSLEQEQERATMTFGALWRPVLALEAWAGHVDAQRAEMWQARYDDHRLIHYMLVQHTVMQRKL